MPSRRQQRSAKEKEVAGRDKMWPLEQSCHWNVVTQVQVGYYLQDQSNLKIEETKFKTNTSYYVIKMRKKRQDPDVPDQKQPHPSTHDIMWHSPVHSTCGGLLGLIMSYSYTTAFLRGQTVLPEPEIQEVLHPTVQTLSSPRLRTSTTDLTTRSKWIQNKAKMTMSTLPFINWSSIPINY